MHQPFTNSILNTLSHWFNEEVQHVLLQKLQLLTFNSEFMRVNLARHSSTSVFEGQLAFTHNWNSTSQCFHVFNETTKHSLSIGLRRCLLTEHCHSWRNVRVLRTGLQNVTEAFVDGISNCTYHFACNTTSTGTIDGNGQWVLGNTTFQFEVALFIDAVVRNEQVHQRGQVIHLSINSRVIGIGITQIGQCSFQTVSGCLIQVNTIVDRTMFVHCLTSTTKEQTTFSSVLYPLFGELTTSHQNHCVNRTVGYTISLNVQWSVELRLVFSIQITGIFHQSHESYEGFLIA